MTHEGLASLFRENPQLATRLLGSRLPIPKRPVLRLEDTAFVDIAPTDYRADAVISIADERGTLTSGLIVEVQLGRDPDKPYSWPRYITALRHQLRCHVDLVIVAPSRGVAAWCAQPVTMGNQGFTLTPWVIGPAQIPMVTDDAIAQELPELSVLSVAAHGREPGAEHIAVTAFSAMHTLDDKRSVLYADLVYSLLGPAARVALEALMQARDYEFQSDFARKYFSKGHAEGHAEGRFEGRIEGLLLALNVRGFTVTERLRERILSCRDLNLLDTWYARARSANSLAELFGPAYETNAKKQT